MEYHFWKRFDILCNMQSAYIKACEEAGRLRQTLSTSSRWFLQAHALVTTPCSELLYQQGRNKSDFLEKHLIALNVVLIQSNNASIKFKWAKLVK